MAYIDPHVHLRGKEYTRDYMEMGFRHAKAVGLQAVGEMPNPDPQLTSDNRVYVRLGEAELKKKNVEHFIHIGLTNDEEQIRDALGSIMIRKYGLTSDKTFYGHSTGNMGILDPDKQRRLWEIKGEMGYKGVSIGHFEAEDMFSGSFDPQNPITHSMYRCFESETISVERAMRNAVDTKFKGVFYIAHCSSPETVDYVESMRGNTPFEIVVEATWHHLFLNTFDYCIHGNRVKMNPPLRPDYMQEELLEKALEGKVQVIGTDHAPHDIARKDDNENPASGIPGIPFWPKGVELLKKLGIDDDLLLDMTFNNANRLFKLGLVRKDDFPKYDSSLWDEYGFNPFSRVDG